MLRPGERLCFEDGFGTLSDTNGWSVEVDQVANWDGDSPFRVFAIDLDALTIRDVTAAFDAAVDAARRPEPLPASTHTVIDGRAA